LVAAKLAEGDMKTAVKLLTPKESWVLLSVLYGNPVNKDNAVSTQDLREYLVDRPDKKSIMSEATLIRVKTKLIEKKAIFATQDGLKNFYTPNWEAIAAGIPSTEGRDLYKKLVQSRVFRNFFNPYNYPKGTNYPHLFAANMFHGSLITHAINVSEEDVKKDRKSSAPTQTEFMKKMLSSTALLPPSLQQVVQKVFEQFYKEYAQLTEEEKEVMAEEINTVGKALLEVGARQFGML